MLTGDLCNLYALVCLRVLAYYVALYMRCTSSAGYRERALEPLYSISTLRSPMYMYQRAELGYRQFLVHLLVLDRICVLYIRITHRLFILLCLCLLAVMYTEYCSADST